MAKADPALYERNQAIVEGFKRGHTKSQLARAFSLSITRINDIIVQDCNRRLRRERVEFEAMRAATHPLAELLLLLKPETRAYVLQSEPDLSYEQIATWEPAVIASSISAHIGLVSQLRGCQPYGWPTQEERQARETLLKMHYMLEIRLAARTVFRSCYDMGSLLCDFTIERKDND